MTDNISNLEEIKKLRSELEQMYLHEKLNYSFLSDETIKYSQRLDVYILEEQRRRFLEYKTNMKNN